MYKKLCISLGFILALVVTFQNCSQGDESRSMVYVKKNDTPNPVLVADTSLNDHLDGLSNTNGIHELPKDNQVLTGDPLAMLDSRSCFQNYISVYEWKNPDANLMSEKPTLSSEKLISLQLNNGMFSTDGQSSTKWIIESILKTSSDGSSYSAIQFSKVNPESADSLDCFFMRALDGATLNAGLANVLFKNVGADLDARIFAGFLRHQEQFIACRVSSGHGDIELKSDGDLSTILAPSQAFILKRGCYPTDVSAAASTK